MTDIRDLPQLIAANQFLPSNRQIRARAAFYQQSQGQDIGETTIAAAIESGAPAAIVRWWESPGFREWWSSPTWEKEESQRLLYQAMNRVSEILRDTEDSDTALKAAKEARELYTKLNTEATTKFADEDIGKMNRQQLTEYIRRNTLSIVEPKKAIDK